MPKQQRIFSVQLGSFCGVPVSVPVAQILPDKGAIAFWKIAIVDLLWSMVQLVAVALGYN